jgi:hypothetical protein
MFNRGTKTYNQFSLLHNIIAFLQSVDTDNNANNGILIDAGIDQIFTGEELDLRVSYSSFDDEELTTLLRSTVNAG